MKKISFLIIVSLLSFFACNRNINPEKIHSDEKTSTYTYKDSGKLVTGTVLYYETDKETRKRYKDEVVAIKNGLRVSVCKYFPNGKVSNEWSFKDGLVDGVAKAYWEDGKLSALTEWKNDELNGVSKSYRQNGEQEKEEVFANGELIQEYLFDENGNKIIPPIEKIELVAIATGFYPYYGQLPYTPIVIMKFKNIDKIPFTEKIKFTATFISNGEELGNDVEYFGGAAPLQPGIMKQISLQCNRGYNNHAVVLEANVECLIYADNKKYKSIKIETKVLNSSLIQ
ncbi:MAG: hypothetical protein LHV68_09740 [Elusimicrobia bacterium]|nr:hypothetical protein [Candidatus Liberimonas magnetica]